MLIRRDSTHFGHFANSAGFELSFANTIDLRAICSIKLAVGALSERAYTFDFGLSSLWDLNASVNCGRGTGAGRKRGGGEGEKTRRVNNYPFPCPSPRGRANLSRDAPRFTTNLLSHLSRTWRACLDVEIRRAYFLFISMHLLRSLFFERFITSPML